MTTTAIREKLQDYIKVADDKKIKAIYTILEGEISAETEWWDDSAMVKELDVRYERLKKGTDKGMSLADVDQQISNLKKKRSAK